MSDIFFEEPEEINRVLTDHVATFLFCPTKQSVDNLKTEGIFNKEHASGNTHSSTIVFCPIVRLVGDVMLDAALPSDYPSSDY